MDFLELAKNRYSERFFDSRPVEQDKLDRILEAGRIVPTACNYQPQRFFLIRSQEGLAKLKTVTHFHYNVPLMILVCYDAREVWTNPNDQYYRNYNSGEQDASIAATTMMYEAKSRRNAMKIMIFHGISPLRGHTTAVVGVPDFFLWMVALIRGAYFCKGMASQEYIYSYEAIFVVIA